MRRHRQQLSDAESLCILTCATSGVLALTGDAGYPYAVPLSHVYSDGHLYFHSALEGHKVDAVRNDSRCSFCVVEQDNVLPERFTTLFRSVIVFGHIHIVADPAERLRALRLLGERFSPGDHAGLEHDRTCKATGEGIKKTGRTIRRSAGLFYYHVVHCIYIATIAS